MTDWTSLPCWQHIPLGDDLALRPLGYDDAEAIVAILQADPSIRTRVGVVAEVEAPADVRRIVDGEGFGPEAVRHVIARGDEVLGFINLWRAGDFFGPLAHPDDFGFGYFLAPAGRGQGLIPLALEALMSVAARQMTVHSFIAFCEDDNPASSRNLVKAGLLATEVVWTSDQGWSERKYERPVEGD